MTQPEQSTTLKVRVQPRSSRNEVLGYQGDSLRVRVTAPPEGGKANEAVIALLADALDIARSRIDIVRGKSSREKLVKIAALEQEELRRRLAALLG